MATIEERLAALEALLAPRAAVPPMTIGELANVPVPGSSIASPWAQDVSSRIVQRFATTALLKAWAAPTGAFAVAIDTGIMWRRAAGGWSQFTPWSGSAAGVALNGVQSGIASTMQIPADLGNHVAAVRAFLQIQVANTRDATIGMTVDGVDVAQAFIPQTGSLTPGGAMFWNIALHADNIVLPVNRAVQVTVSVVISPTPGVGTYLTFAGPIRNRVGAMSYPRGY